MLDDCATEVIPFRAEKDTEAGLKAPETETEAAKMHVKRVFLIIQDFKLMIKVVAF